MNICQAILNFKNNTFDKNVY